jgi:hypothetical protein
LEFDCPTGEDEEIFCGYFQQDSANAFTADHFPQTLKRAFGERL